MRRFAPLLFVGCLVVGCAAAQKPVEVAAAPKVVLPAPQVVPGPAQVQAPVYPVMLGIDVLESQGFASLKGKRIGLLTHPAGVNRRGVTTIEILRHATGVQLVALFSPEHGLYGNEKASASVDDTIDSRTGLPVFSLHGKNRRPTPAQLKKIDALVIDLQDIGVRSYTFSTCMRYAMEACFENKVEVIVLDRPNPLGGFKVDGPALDREWMSGVGGFRVPYVHGLTMGELATMAARAPGVLEIDEKKRLAGKLTVIPMRGWKRAMRWPETGLTFVPTSPFIQDFAGIVGYAMVGLGCEMSGFTHGIGAAYPFRGITFKNKPVEQIQRELEARKIPGLRYRKVDGIGLDGKPTSGIYVEVADWDAWNPTELSFNLMQLGCKFDPPNPFAKLSATQARTFNIHVGSTAWWNALRRDGAQVDLNGFLNSWHEHAKIYQNQSRRYWLYN
ncbi:MAG TPA: DUF1343 domain-containing protein [Opitutaceae bacterium]|nr:DUF1343 domain-containing protein [Opitutaceae bacterium]